MKSVKTIIAFSLAAPVLLFAGCQGGVPAIVGGGDFLDTGVTNSFFTAFQVDPRSEDSAGPQFVAAGDLNGDGLVDLVSAWNQSQPIQIHLQRRNAFNAVSFETITLAGNVPTISVSGLEIADFDLDGRPDIVVLLKETLLDGAGCLGGATTSVGLPGMIVIYFAPTDPARTNQALAWEEVPVGNSFLRGEGDGTTSPEDDGYTSIAVGDINGDNLQDIVAAWNGACGDRVALVFTNLGTTSTRNGTWAVGAVPDPFAGDPIKDVALADIDQDNDLDLVITRPTARSMNVRWLRNPTLDIPDGFHVSNGEWQVGSIGQIDTGADVVDVGDVDNDGLVDVVVRSSGGRLIQWLKGPASPTTQPIRNIPWQVFTIAEFTLRTPQAIALGDITGDGQVELVASAGGALLWFDPLAAPSVFDQWIENIIIDDGSSEGSGGGPATTDPNVTPTEIAGTTGINTILLVDIDGNGSNDIVAPLDRQGLSGLTNDVLVWFRNSRIFP